MSDHISKAQFESEFPRLILGARDLPRKAVPLHTLLISALLSLEVDKGYSEPDLNAELQSWILAFGRGFKLGHSELRRMLVDEGYLTRDPAGREYRVAAEGGTFSFDDDLRQLDLEALLNHAIEEREARKRAHSQ